jgi:hypothetical protein
LALRPEAGYTFPASEQQGKTTKREMEETMNSRKGLFGVVVMLMVAFFVAPAVMAQNQETLTAQGQEVKVPVPTEPGIFTIKGQFARIAYNNEGWVTLGYRTANDSQGQEWMLLEVGVTVRKPTKNQQLTRGSFTVTLPDGSILPMATIEEYRKANSLRALNSRGNTVRDSINYFPAGANQACPMLFFTDPTGKITGLAFDQFEINWQRGCVGRLFFKMPEGKTIETGQYWLNVQFANSIVQTPFRIMTKEEQKFLKKNWKDLKKEHEAFLKSEAEKAKQQQQQ